jgi:hypothetical protein
VLKSRIRKLEVNESKKHVIVANFGDKGSKGEIYCGDRTYPSAEVLEEELKAQYGNNFLLLLMHYAV